MTAEEKLSLCSPNFPFVSQAMKQLIFGSANLSFNDEWRLQGFCFGAEPPELSFGLVQRKGGPCGVLSVVQAELLRGLLFGRLSLAESSSSCARW